MRIGWRAGRRPSEFLDGLQEPGMNQSEMMQKIRDGNGFIAALDQSGGSTPRALKNYGF